MSSSALFHSINPGQTQRTGHGPIIPGDKYDPGKAYTPKRGCPTPSGFPLHHLSLVLGGQAAGCEDYRRDSQDLGEFGTREAKGSLLMLPIKRFYRLDEVAALLGLSTRTIYRMVRDGRIAGVKSGHGPWRIPRESLEMAFRPATKSPSDGEIPGGFLETPGALLSLMPL